MSIQEKKILAELWLIHAEQMSFYNFIILKKKQWPATFSKRHSSTGAFLWNL